MREFQLDELTIEEAQGLLTGLCRSENMQMSAELIDYTLKKLHWNIPYFIQVLFSKLADEFDQEITKDSIDIAYDELCSENYLSTWSERLSEYGDYEVPARQILKALSTESEGLKRESMLNLVSYLRLKTGDFPLVS